MGWAVRGHVGDTRLDTVLGVPVIRVFAGHRETAVALADLGGPETIALQALGLALVLGARARWAGAAAVLLAPAAAGGLTQWVLKPAVGRMLASSPAWPSGHATGTWALLTVVVVLLLRDGPARARLVDSAVLLAVGLVNAVGLVGAQYHFVTDVIGGVAVGVAVGCAVSAGLGLAGPVARRA